MNRYIAYIVLGLAVVVGGGSIIGLMTMDSLKLVNLGLDESGRLWLDAVSVYYFSSNTAAWPAGHSAYG
jgi:hypothetical protein